MRVALVSFDAVWENKDESLLSFEKHVQHASSKEVDCIIFPEMTLTGFSMNSLDLAETFEHSPTIKKYQQFARQHKIKIIAGVILNENSEIFNCCVAINELGEIKEIYKKIHPFSYSQEDKFYTAGTELKTTDFTGVWGITICYDLRFPELYRALAQKSKVIVNIASWPERREDHWQSLLKARAIENQIFMIGVNRSGVDGNGLKYSGISSIYSAEGNFLKPEFNKDGVQIFNLDMSALESYRATFPVREDMKTALYANWLK